MALLPFPRNVWGRILFGLFVTAMPAIAFWGVDALKPEWQDGKFVSYLVLLLFPEASLPFLVLLAYSVICYLCLISAPAYFSKFFPVRLGIYTGVLLALQYSVILLIWSFASSVYFVLPIWVIPFVLIFLYRLALKRWPSEKINRFLWILVLVGITISAIWDWENVFFIILIGLLIAAPFWSFLIALRAAVWLYRNFETRYTLPHGLGVFAWLAGYVAAWRFDILKMYELYAALPPQPPPDCYIATAAARGHPRFVRSQLVERDGGFSLHVNSQLQILKCAELALMAINPRVHRASRRIYDVVGRVLARGIQNQYFADFAYLLLKPWEQLARFILKRFIPEFDSISGSFYLDR
jgi:hypothetical protein